jgi:DNA-binding protein HU-beta
MVWRAGALTREKEAIAMATSNREQSTYGKTSLIDDVTASTQGYSRRQVAEIVDATLKAITDKVRTGQNVTLTGFGTFRRTERAARRGTNIRTRQPIDIPAQSTVRFTPGSELKAAVTGRAAPRRKDQGVQQRERGQSSTRR